MLCVVLGIAIFGWLRARDTLISIRENDYGQYQRTFSVCDNIKTGKDYDDCLATLKDFGKTLSKYERLLKRIRVTERPKDNTEETPAKTETSSSSPQIIIPGAKVKIISTSSSQTLTQ